MKTTKRSSESPDRPAESRIRDSANENLWIAAFLLLVFLLGCFQLSNGDIWWHLRTGQLIWEQGEVPRTDWYTYTNPDATWIDLHWGFQLLTAALWHFGESAALILAKCTIVAIAFGFCLSISKPSWPKWHSAGIWIVPALIFSGRYYVRPEILSVLLLSITLAILYHWPRRTWVLWLLPIVQIAWVNVQGLFVLQFVVMACYLIDRAIRTTWCWGSRSDENTPFRWKTWLVVSVATMAASVINPYGLRGALFPITLFQRLRGPNREFYQQYAGEFTGFGDFLRQHGVWGIMNNTTSSLLSLSFLIGLLSFVLLFAQKRLNIYRVLLFFGFAYLVWQMNRNSVLFAIVAGMVIRLNVGELFEMAADNRRKHNIPQWTVFSGQLSSESFVRWIVGVGLLLLILSVPTGILFAVQKTQYPKRFSLGESPWYPHAAAKLLRSPGMPDHVFAVHAGNAAVCIYHLAPYKKVFSDGRLEVNSRKTLSRYHEIPRQLITQPAKAIENLTRGIRPGPDGQRELPALLFDNIALIKRSITEPGLLQSLLGSEHWQCVFVSLPTDAHPGVSLFLEKERAQQLQLPADDRIDSLINSINAIRQRSPNPIKNVRTIQYGHE